MGSRAWIVVLGLACGCSNRSLDGSLLPDLARPVVDLAVAPPSDLALPPVEDLAIAPPADFTVSSGIIPACLHFMPASADCGAVPVGQAAPPVLVTFSNFCNQSVVVDSATGSGPDAGDFFFALADDPPYVLFPGAQSQMKVNFTPAKKGLRSAALVIVSGDLSAPTYPYPVSGTGT